MGFSRSKRILLASTALLLATNAGSALAQTVVNGADVPIGATDTPSVTFQTDHKATVSDTYNINGTVSTTVDSQGTLEFLGTSTVTDTVGSTSESIKLIELNSVGGDTVTFDGNVYADTVQINNSNTVDFNKTVGGNVDLGNSGTAKVILGDGVIVNGNIYSSADGAGILTIEGGSTINGTVGVDLGGSEAHLDQISVGASGEINSFNGAVETNTINIAGSGTVNFSSTLDVTADINYTGTDSGTVTVTGATTVGGAVNLTGDGTINFGSTLDVGGDIVFGAASTVSFGDAVTINAGAGMVDFNDQDGVMVLGSGVGTFDSNIDNTANTATVGTVRVEGSTTVGGNIGATRAINNLEVAADGTTSEFTGTVNVSTVDVAGNGSVKFSNDLTTDNIVYSDDGVLEVVSGKALTVNVGLDFAGNNGELIIGAGDDVTFNLDNTGGLSAGILTLGGGVQTVSGKLGATTSLSTLNTGAVTSTTLFSDTVNVSTVNIKGDAASATTFNAAVTSTTINVENASTVNFNENVTGTVSFDADGTVNLAAGKSITGGVDATADNVGNLVLAGGAQQVTGDIGATKSINTITSTVDAADIDLLGDVNAAALSVTGNNVLLDVGGDANIADIDLDGAAVTAAFAKSLTATTLDVAQDGADIDVTGATNIGTLTVNGTSTVDLLGTVDGTDFVFAKTTDATFGGDVNLGTLTATGDATDFDFDSNVNITTTTVNGNNVILNYDGTVGGSELTVNGNTAMLTAGGAVNVADINLNGSNATASFANSLTATTFDVTLDGADIDVTTATNIGTLTVSGTSTIDLLGTVDGTDFVFAKTTDATFGGDVNLGTLTATGDATDFDFDSDVNIATTTVTGDNVILNFDGTLTGNELTIDGDTAQLTVDDDANVADINLDGLNATALFSQGLTATTLDVTQDGADLDIVGAANIGTLTLAGTSAVNFYSTVDGTDYVFSKTTTASFVGDTTLSTLTASGNATNLDFDSNVNIGTTVVSGDNAVLNYDGTLDGTELTINGDAAQLTVDGVANVADINVNGANATVSFGDTLTATSLDITQNGADLDIAGDANIGTLTLGGSSAVDFIGTATGTDYIFTGTADVTFGDDVNLTTLTSNGDGSDFDFTSNVTATTLTADGNTANLDFDGEVNVATIGVSGSNAVVDFAKTVTGTTLSVSGLGSDVDFNNDVTVTTINVAEDGGSADFVTKVTSTDINLLGTGAVTFAQDTIGNVNFTGGNGSISIATGADLTGAITTNVDGAGQVTLVGVSSVSGDIGDSINSLASLAAGVDNNPVGFGGDVYVDDVDLYGDNQVGFAGDLYSIDIDLAGSGHIGVDGDLDTSDLDFNSTATLEITGNTVANDINLNDAATIIFGGDVSGATIDGAGTVGSGVGTVEFESGATSLTSIATNGVLEALTLSGTGTTINVAAGDFVSADTLNLGVNNQINVTNGDFEIGTTDEQTIIVNLDSDPNNVSGITADNVDVGLNTKVQYIVDDSQYFADATRYVIVDGSDGNGGVSTIDSITGNSVALIEFRQDTDENDDLVIVIDRTRLETYATSDNTIAIANALDDIGMQGDDAIDAAQLAIQEKGIEGDTEAVSGMLASLASTADGGVITSNLNIGSINMGINEGRLASIRLGDSDYNDGYYGGDHNYTPDEYYIDNDGYYDEDDFYYDTGLSAGEMVDGYSFWMQGYVRDADQKQNSAVSGYDAITYGTVFGIDTSELFEDTIFGISFGYGKTNMKSRNENRTKTDVDNYGLTLYSNYDFNDSMFLDTQLAYGYNSVESRRYDVGGTGLTAEADYHSHQWLAKMAMGYDAWLSNGAILTPVGSASFAYLYNEPYSEKGAGGLGLDVASTHMSVLELGLGAKLSTKMESLDGTTIVKPKMHAMYNYDVISDRLENTSNLQGAANYSFTTQDVDRTNDRINLGVGMDYKTYVWTLSTNYDYEFRKNYVAHSAAMKVSLEF